LRGARPEVPRPGRNRQVTVLGAIEVSTGVWVYRLGRRCTADFIALRRSGGRAGPRLQGRYPTGQPCPRLARHTAVTAYALPCALFCGNDPSGPYAPVSGRGISWWMLVLIVVIGMAALIGAITRLTGNQDRGKRGLRPAPSSDMRPGMRSLLWGRNGSGIHGPGERCQGSAPLGDDEAERERLGSH